MHKFLISKSFISKSDAKSLVPKSYAKFLMPKSSSKWPKWGINRPLEVLP